VFELTAKPITRQQHAAAIQAQIRLMVRVSI